MIGGAGVAIGTFLPWLELNGRVRSGWEVVGLSDTVGGNPAVISPMFGGGRYDIFFTGLVTLPLGVLGVLLMAAVRSANTKPPPTDLKAKAALVASATLAIVTALVATAVNIRTLRLGTPESVQSPVRYGLWVMFLGGLVGTTGMAASISGKRPRSPVSDNPVPDSRPASDSPTSDSPALTQSSRLKAGRDPRLKAGLVLDRPTRPQSGSFPGWWRRNPTWLGEGGRGAVRGGEIDRGKQTRPGPR